MKCAVGRLVLARSALLGVSCVLIVAQCRATEARKVRAIGTIQDQDTSMLLCMVDGVDGRPVVEEVLLGRPESVVRKWIPNNSIVPVLSGNIGVCRSPSGSIQIVGATDPRWGIRTICILEAQAAPGTPDTDQAKQSALEGTWRHREYIGRVSVVLESGTGAVEGRQVLYGLCSPQVVVRNGQQYVVGSADPTPIAGGATNGPAGRSVTWITDIELANHVVGEVGVPSIASPPVDAWMVGLGANPVCLTTSSGVVVACWDGNTDEGQSARHKLRFYQSEDLMKWREATDLSGCDEIPCRFAVAGGGEQITLVSQARENGEWVMTLQRRGAKGWGERIRVGVEVHDEIDNRSPLLVVRDKSGSETAVWIEGSKSVRTVNLP